MTTEIKKSEIRKPKTPEEKALEALQQDVKNQTGDQKLLIKNLNELLPSLYEAFDNIPKEVLKAFATKLEFSLKQTVQLDDGSKIEITNLDALATAVNLLSQEFKTWKAKDSITVKNLKEIKPDLTGLENTINKFEDLIRQYIAKDINVIVNNPDEVFIKNWPKKPGEAIPVVLVDKDLKKFYNSVATFMGGGGGSFVQGPIKFKINGEDTIVDAAHPLPVSIVGDVIITGDVIVDQVGIENIAGVKINPATAENQQTDGLTDSELRATPVPVSGTITLDAATLAALETINALVSGTVALDAPTLAALENIIVTGTVALDAATLAALETINAVVSGTVDLGATTLAALESITAVVSGTVELGATTLAALENITATVPGVATAANQTTGNASLTNVETYLRYRFGGGKTSVPFTVTASGDTTIYTPAAGKAIRLFSIDAITDPDELLTPLIKVLIGTNEKLRGHALGKWEVFTGAADEVLKINLSAASSVSGTVILEEFTP